MKHEFLTGIGIAGILFAATDALARTGYSKVCEGCHSAQFENKYIHYPANGGLCDGCHEVKPAHFKGGDKQYVRTDRSQVTCYRCHERKDTKPNVHAALAMGDDSCMTCHDPHGAKNPYLFREEISALCLGCHDLSTNGVSKHGPVTSGLACVQCHDGHGSNQKKLLTKEPRALCLNCHDRPVKSASGRVIPDMKERTEKMASVHMPAADACSECHLPHASAFPKLLNANFPSKDYNKYFAGDDQTPNTYALCFQCHAVSMMTPEIVMDGNETKFRSDRVENGKVTRVNLHYLHITNAGATTGPAFGRSCRVCHDPHGAPQDRLIRATFSSNAPLKFEATPNGGTCALSCHGPESYERAK